MLWCTELGEQGRGGASCGCCVAAGGTSALAALEQANAAANGVPVPRAAIGAGGGSAMELLHRAADAAGVRGPPVAPLPRLNKLAPQTETVLSL